MSLTVAGTFLRVSYEAKLSSLRRAPAASRAEGAGEYINEVLEVVHRSIWLMAKETTRRLMERFESAQLSDPGQGPADRSGCSFADPSGLV